MITFNNPQVPPSGLRGLLHMNILLISAFLLGGCTVPNAEPVIDTDTTGLRITQSIKEIYEKNPNGKNWVLVGDTIVRKKDVKLHTPPKQVDLGDLKKKDGSTLKYVAIGSSLTAGVREGGLHQEGQQTSFPNLLARQMLIADFSQPLFGDNDFNGYGYKTLSSYSDTQVPKYKVVSNNNAIREIKGDFILLNKYNGKNDNYGVAFLTLPGLLFNFSNTIDYKNDAKEYPYLERIITNSEKKNSNLKSVLTNKTFDLFTLEIGTEHFLNFALSSGKTSIDILTQRMDATEKDFIAYARQINSKGIVFTVPDILDFPYFNLIRTSKLQNIFKKNIYLDLGDIATSETRFLLDNTIDSLLNDKIKENKKGLSKEKPIPSSSVLRDNQIQSIQKITNYYNNSLLFSARYYNYPVVDLYDIYKKIHSFNYVSRDGVKVDPTFLKGNFYSSDGIYPSAFGQAVIANEVIYMLNFYYGTKIPYIDSKEYLLTKK